MVLRDRIVDWFQAMAIRQFSSNFSRLRHTMLGSSNSPRLDRPSSWEFYLHALALSSTTRQCVVICTRLSVIYLDEFKICLWKDVSEIQELSLVALASSLPRVVLNTKPRNTGVRYAYGWNRWKTWWKPKFGVTYLPGQPMFVALYLQHLLNSAKTTSPVDTVLYNDDEDDDV